MSHLPQLVNRFEQLSVVLNDADADSVSSLKSGTRPVQPNLVRKKRRRKKHQNSKTQSLITDTPLDTSSLLASSSSPNSSVKQGIPYGTSADTFSVNAFARLQPRGFQNYKNCCYLNVSLQTLLHCLPVSSLFHDLQKDSGGVASVVFKPGSLGKLMYDLFDRFVRMPPYPANCDHKELSSKPVNVDGSRSLRRAASTECYSRQGIFPYELGPTLCVSPEFASVLQLHGGFQEDGAECLTRLISQLHEEFGKHQTSPVTSPKVENGLDDDSTGWLTIDRSGKLRPEARKTELQGGMSPIGELFSGFIITRSTMNSSRTPKGGWMPKGSCSYTKEPFFMLPLEITDPKITTLETALLRLGESEVVTDYHDDVTGTVSSLQRRLSIDRLPPYLILHLKRFSYTPTSDQASSTGSGGLEKSVKLIEIPVKLTIPMKILNSENAFSIGQRRYLLYAAIFHIGLSATSGHYTVAIRWGPDKPSYDSTFDQFEYLYLDDTRACLVCGTEPLRSLLASHCPLDTLKCRYHPLPTQMSSNTNPPILQQPRTPYILIYESSDFLHSHLRK